ncbi:MAG: VOC family protein [Chloroflexi bacterium]|nr:VOC family protein [Chloroflexota bacterium]
MLTFKHYTVAVHDLDEAVRSHQRKFAMEPIGERAHNGIGNFDFVRMGYGGEVTMHLIQPSGEESPIYRLMQERINDFNPHGEGIYLLAYDCDDIEAFTKQIEDDGGRVTRAPSTQNVWVHPTSSNFVLMELFPSDR